MKTGVTLLTVLLTSANAMAWTVEVHNANTQKKVIWKVPADKSFTFPERLSGWQCSMTFEIKEAGDPNGDIWRFITCNSWGYTVTSKASCMRNARLFRRPVSWSLSPPKNAKLNKGHHVKVVPPNPCVRQSRR